MRRLFVCLWVGLWWWGGSTAVAAQTPPVPVAVYWEQLAETRDLLAELTAVPVAEQRLALAAAADEWEAITAVMLPDGRVISVQPATLTRLMRAEEPDLAQLNAHLTTLLSAQAEWPPPQLPALDEAALAEILARPEFQYEAPEPNAIQRFWRDLQRRFWDFVGDLLPQGEVSFPLGDLVTFLGLIALFLILLYALRSLFADLIAEAAIQAAHGEDEEHLTADIALKRAQEHSGSGDYRVAVRYLYLSSLLLLEERDLLRYDRSLTNREYLRSLAHRPHLAAILREVIDVFDRVWYGFQPLAADEYETYAHQVEQLKQQREKS